MKEPNQKQVQKHQYLGKKFVYCIDDSGSVLLAAKSFFVALLGRLGYSKAESMDETDCVFEQQVGRSVEQFYPSNAIKQRLDEYQVPQAKLDENPEKYKDYLQFIESGGVDALVGGIKHKQVKDSSIVLCESTHDGGSTKIKSDSDYLQSRTLLDKIEELERDCEDKQRELQRVTEFAKQEQANNASLKQRVKQLLEHIDNQRNEANKDRLGNWLKQNSVQTYLTIFVILTFLPFTVGVLVRYIPFTPTSTYLTVAFWVLCVAMATVWDMSILYFAKTGRRTMSKVGSVYQFLFFCTEFDLIANIFSDLLRLDGQYWQAIIVTFCIVTFSPVLVNQFTELSVEPNRE